MHYTGSGVTLCGIQDAAMAAKVEVRRILGKRNAAMLVR